MRAVRLGRRADRARKQLAGLGRSKERAREDELGPHAVACEPRAELLVVLITGLGYGTAAMLLISPRIKCDLSLSSRSAMLWLIGVAVASIALVSAGYVLVLLLHGVVAEADLGQVFVRAFVGDLIGVMVFTPFLLIAFTRREFPALSWEMGALMLITLAAIWGILSLNQPFRFQLFYILFLPIVWIAVRFGLRA